MTKIDYEELRARNIAYDEYLHQVAVTLIAHYDVFLPKQKKLWDKEVLKLAKKASKYSADYFKATRRK